MLPAQHCARVEETASMLVSRLHTNFTGIPAIFTTLSPSILYTALKEKLDFPAELPQ